MAISVASPNARELEHGANYGRPYQVKRACDPNITFRLNDNTLPARSRKR